MNIYARRYDTSAAAQLHVAHQGQEYEARGACASVSSRRGIPVPDPCEEAAGMSGCGAAEVSDVHIREWLLLAWTSRLQVCDEAKVQCGVLADEDSEQHQA